MNVQDQIWLYCEACDEDYPMPEESERCPICEGPLIDEAGFTISHDRIFEGSEGMLIRPGSIDIEEEL